MITITPYEGFANLTLKMSFDDVCLFLKNKKEQFTTEHWPNKGCSPEVAWDIIRIGETISLFFAKGKMFKMYFENGLDCGLDNGIFMGMPIKDAMKIDPNLTFDDWEEEYVSLNGYWLEDDPETGEIISISVFIKELEDDDVFYSYEWCADFDT